MRTILIARPESVKTSQRINLLAGAGYNVISCTGPWPPTRCGRDTLGYWPLSEGADLMLCEDDSCSALMTNRYLEAASRSAFSLTAFFDRRANYFGKEGLDQATELGMIRRGRRQRTAVTT